MELSPHRLSYSVTLLGDQRGLKTFIQQCLLTNRIAGEVERVLGENGYTTTVKMEGVESRVRHTKAKLIKELQIHFPTLQIPTDNEWIASPSLTYHSTDSRLETRIHHTVHDESLDTNIREHSSGQNSKVDVFEELAPNDSASEMGSRSISFLGHLAHAIKKIEKSIITVSYVTNTETRTKEFDITTLVTMAGLLNLINSCQTLSIPIIARKIYRVLPDGRRSYVDEVTTLEAGKEYFVETDLNKPVPPLSTFTTMEEFFEKLQSVLEDPAKRDRQMQQVRQVFDDQDVQYNTLMATGDLALTDQKLKEDGIAQRGLRTAILAVIQSNLKWTMNDVD